MTETLCACGAPEWNDTGQCERCQDYSEMYEDDALSQEAIEDVYYNICDR